MIQIGEAIQVPSFEERLSKRGYQNLPKGVKRDFNVLFVLTRHGAGRRGNDIKKWFFAKNIVNDEGDKFYAQRGAGESPTQGFAGANGRMELRTGAATPAKTDTYGNVTTPVTTSRKIITSGYPKTNDADVDNTGAGIDIVTWLTSWTKTDFSASGIVGGCIHDGAAAPVSGTKLLTHFSVSSFSKTTDDTLKGFINHQMNGI